MGWGEEEVFIPPPPLSPKTQLNRLISNELRALEDIAPKKYINELQRFPKLEVILKLWKVKKKGDEFRFQAIHDH